MSAKSKWCKYKKSKVQTWGPNGVGCGVQMGQVQTGLLYNNNCTCDVSKCKVSKNNCKSPKSKHGVQNGWGVGSKQGNVQRGLLYPNKYI